MWRLLMVVVLAGGLSAGCTQAAEPIPTPTPTPIATPTPTPIATPTPTPDPERDTIITFTRQALAIEAKRNELMAYFAANSPQEILIRWYFLSGVPASGAYAIGKDLEGMSSLQASLLLLDSPQGYSLSRTPWLTFMRQRLTKHSSKPSLTQYKVHYSPEQ